MDAKKSLREDSFVNLYIGKTPPQQSFRAPPYCRVPASLLINVSTRLEKLIKKHHLTQPAKEGTLHVIGDDQQAWDLLLYYAQLRQFPPEIEDSNVNCKLLVDAWILGQDYEVSAFQDLIMLELLQHPRHGYSSGLPLINDAYVATPRGSAMHNDELDGPAQIYGFMCKFLKALEKYRKMGSSLFERFDDEATGEDKRMLWREFMVDGGPRVHWVYDE